MYDYFIINTNIFTYITLEHKLFNLFQQKNFTAIFLSICVRRKVPTTVPIIYEIYL